MAKFGCDCGPPAYCAANPSMMLDRKSTRLNSSHSQISYAVFCLKKKKKYKYVNADNVYFLAHVYLYTRPSAFRYPSPRSHSPTNRSLAVATAPPDHLWSYPRSVV